MKVILNQTVPKVGKEGQVVSVADGFARNFLFPKGIAVPAAKSTLAQLAQRTAKQTEVLEKTKSSAESVSAKINGQTIRVVGKTAKGSAKLFGAVTSADIADALKAATGVELEKKHVALLHPIKRIGVYDIMIDLHREVDAHVKLEVSDEEGNLGIEEIVEKLEDVDIGEPEVVTVPADGVPVETGSSDENAE